MLKKIITDSRVTMQNLNQVFQFSFLSHYTFSIFFVGKIKNKGPLLIKTEKFFTPCFSKRK